MLSLKGARQISGNKVTMSIFIEKENVQQPARSASRMGATLNAPRRIL
jgi:hypothetical protein